MKPEESGGHELLAMPQPVECAFNAFIVRRVGGWCYHEQCRAFRCERQRERQNRSRAAKRAKVAK